MPIQYVSGDLFANAHGAQAFAHGCNCQGAMGAGIAVGFRERYPEMYAAYRQRCLAQPRQFNPGDVFLWKAGDQPWVFNLATQEDTWRSLATYPAVEATLTTMRQMAGEENLQRIAIPQIGAGYGGLDWEKVKAIVEKVFSGWSGTLIVYERYVPGQ